MTDFRTTMAVFDRAVERTIRTCSHISHEVWNDHPRPGWSISEVVEHVTITNTGLAGLLRNMVRTPAGNHPFAVMEDEEIPFLFERADEPPGVSRPTGEWREVDLAMAKFAESARGLSELVNCDTADFRMKGMPHPLFGPLDGVQWAIFATAHIERHRSEIIKLQSSARFRQESDG